jgi:hypothetical protein
MPLSPQQAADLYRSGQSACVIAAEHKLTRSGTEDKIRRGGLRGLVWCALHHTYEELH